MIGYNSVLGYTQHGKKTGILSKNALFFVTTVLPIYSKNGSKLAFTCSKSPFFCFFNNLAHDGA